MVSKKHIDAQEFLKRIKNLDILINSKLEDRRAILDMATKITAGLSDMPRGTDVSDKVGECVVKLIALAEETNELVDQFIDEKREVIRYLERLPAKEYEALHAHYILYKKWEDVANDMHYSESYVWKIHQKGLRLLKKELKR